jgi:peptide/nickel transport system ATP-binding protein
MAAHLGDEIAVMDRGRVVEQGVPEKLLHAPEQEATRRLVAAIPGSSVTPRLPRAL